MRSGREYSGNNIKRNHNEATLLQINYEKTVQRDYLGRPMKTRKGLWITYPGDEGISDSRYNSNSVITRTKSYRENSDSMNKSSDARRADRYKEKFLKSGKITDLHRYREALKDYYKD